MTALTNVVAEIAMDVSALTILYEENGKTVYRLTVPRLDAFAIWRTLYGLTERTGHLPVIMGDPLQLEWLNHRLDLYARSNEPHLNAIDTIVEHGLALDANAWLARESRGVAFQHSTWSEAGAASHEDDWRLPKYYK